MTERGEVRVPIGTNRWEASRIKAMDLIHKFKPDTSGLDPVIQGNRRRNGAKLDYRVKPGNDEKKKTQSHEEL